MSEAKDVKYPSGQPAHRWLIHEIAKRSDAAQLSWHVIVAWYTHRGTSATDVKALLHLVERVRECEIRLVPQDSNPYLSPIPHVAWFRIVQDYDEPLTVKDYNVPPPSRGGCASSDEWERWIEEKLDKHDVYCARKGWRANWADANVNYPYHTQEV